MKAIAITGRKDDITLIQTEEPAITSPTQVKLKIIEIGVCGTDREQVSSGQAETPNGSEHLIIGHEMFGRVVAVGEALSGIEVGDYGVFSVRRGCGACIPCLSNRSDMCYTGAYRERGIKELHGFETEYVVDEAQYFVKVPEAIASIGVLTEPMSIAQKAIDEAIKIQVSRLPQLASEHWLEDKKVLVAGLGAIGLLAAIALRLRGANVWGLDIVDEKTTRPTLLKKIGGQYIDGRKLKAQHLDETIGEADFIFEATGVADLGFQLIDALGINGIYVMTGIPHDERPVCITGAELMKQIVLKNQIILGSVNASPYHFALAIKDLERANSKWPDVMEQVITTRMRYTQFKEAIFHRSENDIKTVIEWNNGKK